MLRAHGFAGSRAHGDDTAVPVLAKQWTRKSRLWIHVARCSRGRNAPAAVFIRATGSSHLERHLGGYAGILSADAYAGLNRSMQQVIV
jgi:transposase